MTKTQLYYPCLSIYSYYAIESLGANEQRIRKALNQLQKLLPNEPLLAEYFDPKKIDKTSIYQRILPQTLAYTQGSKQDSHRVKNHRLWFDEKPGKYHYNGYYDPIVMDDTCLLFLDCSSEANQPLETAKYADFTQYLDGKLQNFRELNAKRQKLPIFLGETWFLYGWSDQPIEEYEQIAKDCYQSWLKGFGDQYKDETWEKNCRSKANFCGGLLFELFPPKIDGENNHHLMIIIYPNYEKLEDSVKKLTTKWHYLLKYRHKILFAYRESRKLEEKMKEKFYEIFYKRGEILDIRRKQSSSLIQVEEILSDIQDLTDDYSLNLTAFEYQAKTIKINLGNYQEKVKEFSSYGPELETLLGDLIDKTENKYLQQIKWDQENLSPGITLISSLRDSIETTRAIIEIRRAEGDRNFQKNVGIWGITLGIGAIVASLSAQFPTVIVPVVIVPKASPPATDLTQKHPFYDYILKHLPIDNDWLSVVLSSIIVLLAMIAIWLIIKYLWPCFQWLIREYLCSFFQSRKTRKK